MSDWYAIKIDCASLDQQTREIVLSQLLWLGAEAIDESTPDATLIYFKHNTSEQVTQAYKLLEQHNILYQPHKLVDENWLEAWFKDWRTLQIGHLEIIPVKENAKLTIPNPNDKKNCIYINPGLGFGTGHHPTTAMLLKLLQDSELHHQPIKKIIDLGCGSGILAIAAAKLYSAEVMAIDIDDYALSNAKDNLHLNQLDRQVKLSNNNLKDISEKYDLILANLYAELLIEFAKDISTRIRLGGYALISGILKELWISVENEFIKNGWTTIIKLDSYIEYPTSEQQQEWVAALIKYKDH